MTHPQLYVIAGPNGAGKTTFAKKFLPSFADCPNFVNVDLIASGLSPFEPEKTALKAGRLMLQEIHEFARRKESFGFETTLSGKKYLHWINDLRRVGYKVNLIFLWLPNVDIAVQRVKDRVKLGGHFVPEIDIRRRFDRGLENLFKIYIPNCDTWHVLNNSLSETMSVAYGTAGKKEFMDPDFERKVQKYFLRGAP